MPIFSLHGFPLNDFSSKWNFRNGLLKKDSNQWMWSWSPLPCWGIQNMMNTTLLVSLGALQESDCLDIFGPYFWLVLFQVVAGMQNAAVSCFLLGIKLRYALRIGDKGQIFTDMDSVDSFNWNFHICIIFTRWWFQIFVIFTPIWGRFPFWLIFFKGVETTNQYNIPFVPWMMGWNQSV